MPRRFFACLAACLFLVLALAGRAQSPSEGLELVRGFYAPGFTQIDMPLSRRLSELLDAAIANNRKHDAPVTGLDFDWTVNAQDTVPGFETTLRFSELGRGETGETVGVTFDNGRAEELHYALTRENGRLVVDDISYLRPPATSLSQMLRTGATETP
ncbi:MAG: hypothetical protein AB7R90_17950 [Reyranellaceae bacterium]